MNNQILIIYDYPVLFDILKEIKENLNFKLLNLSAKEYSKFQTESSKNYLLISNKEHSNFKNQILIDTYPIKLSKIIEIININFLKKKFNQQSEIDIGLYSLNLNSRKIYNDNNELDLTEKEAEIIIFLKKSQKPVTINKLQIEVWGHSSKLETHTVETHIYRLRKKIADVFNNSDFIKSTKSGYIIK
tara:strand:+ start:2311 stop:2874 length:564 start_codon:yes stop_codon:yes gene_type:complete